MPHHAAPPFVEYVGINAVPDEDGAVVAEVELVQHLLNRSGAAHGGLIATLLDTTLARAAIAGDGGGRGRLATVEMNVTYVSPGRIGLRCRAWCRGRTENLAFCVGEVHDYTGALVARGTATFRH